jgi:hypothetical protein
MLYPLALRPIKKTRPIANTTTPTTANTIIPPLAPSDVFPDGVLGVKEGIGVEDCACSSTTSGAAIVGAAGVVAGVTGKFSVGAPVGVLVEFSVGTGGGVQVGVGETNSVITGGPVIGSGHS